MTKHLQTPPSLAVDEAKPAAEEDGILIVETISKTTTEGPEAVDKEVHAVAAPAEDVEERERIFVGLSVVLPPNPLMFGKCFVNKMVFFVCSNVILKQVC